MSQKAKMGDFLREVSNWSWEEFWRAERDKTYTSNQAIIFALVRACAGQDLQAIKLSLNRMDGKLKTPVIIEAPKIYYIYPYAKEIEGGVGHGKIDYDHNTPPQTTDTVSLQGGHADQIIIDEPEATENDLPSLSLRETLNKMSDYSRDTPDAIVELALRTEQWLRETGPRPDNIPRVKSVVAAHLLVMAQKKNMGAITEVLDQIDGKLVETIQIIGEDITITSYSSTAPVGAYLNKDGILQMEASAAQDIWASKLGGNIV